MPVTFAFVTIKIRPNNNTPSQNLYDTMEIPFTFLKETPIAYALEHCGGTPYDLGTIKVPKSIGMPKRKELIRCLEDRKSYLDNPGGKPFVAETEDVNTMSFLDFMCVNVKFKRNSNKRSMCSITSQEYDESFLNSLSNHEGWSENDDWLDYDDYKPGRSTKSRIQQKRSRQGNYDPCGEDYEDYDEDEMYAEWIESLNIEEQDLTL